MTANPCDLGANRTHDLRFRKATNPTLTTDDREHVGATQVASERPTSQPAHNGIPGELQGRAVVAALAELRAMPSLELASISEDESSVYFIESAGLVKIGLSSTPRTRLLGLINSAGAEVRILAVAPGTWTREQHLHSLLPTSRHHGEWFVPTDAIVGWTREAQANSEKWNALPNGFVPSGPSKPFVRHLSAAEQRKSESVQAAIRDTLQLLADAERAGEIAGELARDKFLSERNPDLAERERSGRRSLWADLGLEVSP